VCEAPANAISFPHPSGAPSAIQVRIHSGVTSRSRLGPGVVLGWKEMPCCLDGIICAKIVIVRIVTKVDVSFCLAIIRLSSSFQINQPMKRGNRPVKTARSHQKKRSLKNCGPPAEGIVFWHKKAPFFFFETITKPNSPLSPNLRISAAGRGLGAGSRSIVHKLKRRPFGPTRWKRHRQGSPRKTRPPPSISKTPSVRATEERRAPNAKTRPLRHVFFSLLLIRCEQFLAAA